MKLIFMTAAAVMIAVAVSGCAPENKNAAALKKTAAPESPAIDSLKRLPPVAAGKTETSAAPANIGDTVSIGVFDYLVEGVSFRTTIASGAMHETAGGIFLLLKLTFANHDRQPHAVDTSLVRVIDAKNAGYACSAPAGDIITMTGKNCLCSKMCRPGETIRGTMVFDVPSKAEEYRLKVSDGAWKESTREILLVPSKDNAAVR